MLASPALASRAIGSSGTYVSVAEVPPQSPSVRSRQLVQPASTCLQAVRQTPQSASIRVTSISRVPSTILHEGTETALNTSGVLSSSQSITFVEYAPSISAGDRHSSSYTPSINKARGATKTPVMQEPPEIHSWQYYEHHQEDDNRTMPIKDGQSSVSRQEPAVMEHEILNTMLHTPMRGERWENPCTHLSPIESVSDISQSLSAIASAHRGVDGIEGIDEGDSVDSSEITPRGLDDVRVPSAPSATSTRASNNPIDPMEIWCDRENLPVAVHQRLQDEALKSPNHLLTLNRKLVEAIVKDLQIGVQAQFFAAVDRLRFNSGLSRIFT